jgi:DNA-binding NarL/FixJ family response regulator
MQPIEVVVVDDHELVRTGLATLLGQQEDLRCLGSARTGEEGVELISQLRPDVAIVDYSLPKMNGIEVCEEVVRRFPSTAVIMLSVYMHDEVVIRSVKGGARGYICKDAEMPELVRAVRAVARGEAVVDPKVAGRLMSFATGSGTRSRMTLSLKETEVLRRVSRGATNKEIARAMGVTENTVKTLLRRILRKLDCHNRSEAAAVAVAQGLL